MNWVPTKLGWLPTSIFIFSVAEKTRCCVQISRSFPRMVTSSSSISTSARVFNPTRPNFQRKRQVSVTRRRTTHLPPNDEANDFTAAPSLPEFNQAALEQLEAMGFPLIRCQKALLATGNSDVEAAMEWLFAHLEDPGKALRTTKL